MRPIAVAVLAVLALVSIAARARAAAAYVTDQLVLNVYAEQNQQGAKLATLRSGASVETLATSGEYTQVRLGDGTTGWVKSAYLTTEEPASARVQRLQAELDRSRATTPELALAAERTELEQVKGELAAKQSELDAERAARPAPREAAGARPVRAIGYGAAAAGLAAAGALGFWAGYAALARRIKRKFGGLKVY